MSDARGVVYPAPTMLARVRIDDVPREAPAELAPYLTPHVVDDEVVDWLLTTDTVAFGEPRVASDFKDWRGTWLEHWELEPVDSVQRLFRLIAEARTLDDASQRVAEQLMLTPFEREELVIQPARAVLIPEVVERARALAVDVEESGIGLVDTTEGARVVGLLAAWPPSSRDRLLAQDDRSQVALYSERGLCLTVDDPTGVTVQVDDLTEVVFHGATALVRTEDRTHEFDADHVRPLAWIALGARSYRVRRVPAVVTVANTVARLPDAARLAIEYGRELVLTGVAPVVSGR
jgi:hypothetical protein